MATGKDNSLIRHLRRAAFLHDDGELTDGQLLERFLATREEAAFEVLVRRHGPMVLGVCRRVLSNVHDAEDAFQAAFLVLIRKGPSLPPRQTLGNWLYGVAYHTALKARAASWKRRAKERQAAAMSKPHETGEDMDQDWLPLLDRELDRLPTKYREAVVLCELEGKTREEAARQLGVPTGTLSGRLTTARRMLAQRLTRRGVTLTGTALATALTPSVVSASLPPALVGSTLEAVTVGAVSAEVAALTHGMLKSMLLAKLKLTTAVLLTATALSGSAGVFAYRVAGQSAAPSEVVESSPQPDLPEPEHPDAERLPEPREEAKLEGKTPAERSDKERLQGEWIPVKSIVKGEATDINEKKAARTLILIFDDNMAAFWDGKGPYKIAPDEKPKQLDIEVHRKDQKELVKAIYQFDKDRLIVSWMKGADERPPDFETGKNKGVLIVYEKAKP
ncbi:MAG TPA: sigma-70 family RNA polymerase sigma factor [Gemmataceae bacterium]|nr:sigma-70 family RNA polymerase sigma factor [Gemmataceae bacterium]